LFSINSHSFDEEKIIQYHSSREKNTKIEEEEEEKTGKYS